jgi:hypothetical protein
MATASPRRPLIQGAAPPPPDKLSGLPNCVELKNVAGHKKLPAWDASAAFTISTPPSAPDDPQGHPN